MDAASSGLVWTAIITTVGGHSILLLRQWLDSRRAKRDREALKETVVTDAHKKDTQLVQIHTLVNGRLSQALRDLKALRLELKALKGKQARAQAKLTARRKKHA